MVIVVVEEDSEILESINNYFGQRDYEVTIYRSSFEILNDCARFGRSWDVLLTNHHFINMSEDEFTSRLRAVLPDLPIILITPPESTENALKFIGNGAYDLITKPIDFTQLRLSVDRAVRLRFLQENLSKLQVMVNSNSTGLGDIIGRSPKFLEALDIARRVAPSHANVIISGESGTGKEVFAKFVHQESKQRDGPFVAINCSAIPENLLESELFGHAKGAFTGAYDKKVGLFEEAQNGTLFMDEIGDMSLSLQAKLLRVLQEKMIRRVGENRNREVNCRLIFATHKDLANEVREHRFREDLFFRLNVIPIAIPPLRERQEDIVPLAEAFLRKYATQNCSIAKVLSKEALRFIVENKWRGNVRELENMIERSVVLSAVAEISLDDLMPKAATLDGSFVDPRFENRQTFFVPCADGLPTVDEVVRRYVEFAVAAKGGARDKTAKEIGIDRKTLYKRLHL